MKYNFKFLNHIWSYSYCYYIIHWIDNVYLVRVPSTILFEKDFNIKTWDKLEVGQAMRLNNSSIENHICLSREQLKGSISLYEVDEFYPLTIELSRFLSLVKPIDSKDFNTFKKIIKDEKTRLSKIS